MGMEGGEVDGCSSFGVKSVIKRAIICYGFFYNTPAELVTFLKNEKIECENFHYVELDSENFQDERKTREELVIEGCRSM